MKTYACRYPGCVRTFKRSDNLRSHQRDKGHVVHVDMGVESGDREFGKGGGKRRKVEVGLAQESGGEVAGDDELYDM
jgi:hypothetical protein